MISCPANSLCIMGSSDGNSNEVSYSVPSATAKVYQEGILSNPLIAKDLPTEVQQSLTKINFVGSDSPSLPVNWRLAEAVSSLKALEATLVDVILQRRHGCGSHQVTINTDHASLFLFSTLLWTIDEGGENISPNSLRQADPKLFKYFPSCDKYRMNATIHRNLATNIYKCADGRFFQAHGSLNPTPTLLNVGLPPERDAQDYDEGMRLFQEAFGNLDSETMQKITALKTPHILSMHEPAWCLNLLYGPTLSKVKMHGRNSFQGRRFRSHGDVCRDQSSRNCHVQAVSEVLSCQHVIGQTVRQSCWADACCMVNTMKALVTPGLGIVE